MDTSCMKSVITDFIDGKKGRAILIDGPWGCGKTYSICKAIEEIKNSKNKESTTDNDGKTQSISLDHIIYVSLFGFESIDEIHTDIYQKYNKKIIKFKRAVRGTLGVISKAASFVPISGIDETMKAITSEITNLTNDNKKELTNGPFIVFFDDLERLSNKISYADLLGYFNNRIFENNGRIVCLSNQDIINENQRYKEFKEFKEKIFDREYHFGGDVNSIFDSLFKELKIDKLQLVYNQFHSNIRYAIKTKIFYQELIGRIDDSYEYYENIFPKLTIFKCCISAIENSFINGQNTNVINSKLQRFNPDEALEFAIQKVFLNLDYSYLNSLFSNFGFEKGKHNNPIFLQKYKLLSDEDKKIYEDSLSDSISNDNFTWSWGFQIQLGSVLSYNKDFQLTESQLDNIARKIDDWRLTHKGGLFEDFKKWSGNRNDVINQLKTRQASLQIKKQKSTMEEAYNKKNYSHLIHVLLDLNTPDEKINNNLDFLFNNCFFLPDLSKTISPTEDTYCNELAKLLRKHGSSKIKRDFLNFLKGQGKNKPNSKTLKYRIDDLTNQLNDN